jgi:hypothetical protein
MDHFDLLRDTYCWNCERWHPIATCCCRNTALLCLERTGSIVNVRTACPVSMCPVRTYQFQCLVPPSPSVRAAATAAGTANIPPLTFLDEVAVRRRSQMKDYCPGLRGDPYSSLYCAGPQGSLTPADLRAALNACPGLAQWHPKVRSHGVGWTCVSFHMRPLA